MRTYLNATPAVKKKYQDSFFDLAELDLCRADGPLCSKPQRIYAGPWQLIFLFLMNTNGNRLFPLGVTGDTLFDLKDGASQ